MPSAPQPRNKRLIFTRLAKTIDAGNRGNDHDIASLEERAGRGMAHLVDLVIDIRVLRDVRVGARYVRLGLVVVVVRDEVLHHVLREELAELLGELRGQRAVRRQHQRRTLIALDHVRHRERLACTGSAAKRLSPDAVFEAANQCFNRLRLVAHQFEV